MAAVRTYSVRLHPTETILRDDGSVMGWRTSISLRGETPRREIQAVTFPELDTKIQEFVDEQDGPLYAAFVTVADGKRKPNGFDHHINNVMPRAFKPYRALTSDV